ncbi:MAG TPA: cell division protein ZapA [Nitrospinota bacterium]|nr:cell division protein ZapA [Nitrospinota bacterium]
MKYTTQVEIFGKKYTIRSDSDPSYTAEVADFVDKKIREVAENYSAISSHKIYILASIDIANDLFQVKKKCEDKALQSDERIARLIKIIEENIKNFP